MKYAHKFLMLLTLSIVLTGTLTSKDFFKENQQLAKSYLSIDSMLIDDTSFIRESLNSLKHTEEVDYRMKLFYFNDFTKYNLPLLIQDDISKYRMKIFNLNNLTLPKATLIDEQDFLIVPGDTLRFLGK